MALVGLGRKRANKVEIVERPVTAELVTTVSERALAPIIIDVEEEVAKKGELQVLEGRLAEVNALLDELNDKKMTTNEQHTNAMRAMDILRANELQLQLEGLQLQIKQAKDQLYVINYSIHETVETIRNTKYNYEVAKERAESLENEREKLIKDHERALENNEHYREIAMADVKKYKEALHELGGEV